jgi:two-component system response regulator FixJ
MTPTPTVFVVDDDVSFLRSLARLLRASGFQVVGHNSAAEFLAELRPDLDGCVITDLMMPGMDGMALQEALRKAGSALPILFLTGHGDIPTTVQAMRRGADDFLTKHAPKADLIAAVNRALARNEQDRAERARLQALRAPFAALTPRDREVLGHVLAGQLNKQIAADLGIDERSVKRHRTSIMTKLRVQSVAQLTRLVQEAGFDSKSLFEK